MQDPPTELASIALAARTLRSGGVVAFPTETVYGLGADALNPAAVARVFALKGRPSINPLIVHVTGREMALTVAQEWPPWAETLARAFWPGPLTLVLPRAGRVPEAVTAGGPTVAVRCPDHPTALALLFEFGGPLVGPSANPSGRVSPTRAAHVRDAFSADDVMVLDGGACSAGIESTVVRMRDGRPEILRPGVIGPWAISRALGLDDGALAPRVSSAPSPRGGGAETLASPGLLSEHYAPNTPAVRFERARWGRVVEFAAGRPVAVLSMGGFSASEPALVIEMPADPNLYAAGLYAALREADASGAGLIAVESPPLPTGRVVGPGEVWLAIADRLRRATRPLDDR